MIEINLINKPLLATTLLPINLLLPASPRPPPSRSPIPLLVDLHVWIPLLKTLLQLLIVNKDPRELVSETNPARPAVVRPRKQLHLGPARTHPLYETVDLVGLPAGLSDLGDYHVAVDVAVDLRVAFEAHEAVFLGVVEPVAGSACPDDALELVGFDPDYFLDAFVAPELEALAAELHCSACHPEEDQTRFLEEIDSEVLHLFVFEGAVGKLAKKVSKKLKNPINLKISIF